MSEEPRVGMFFYDEENAMLMVFDKDLNPNEVAEVYADSPCGFIMAEALNRITISHPDELWCGCGDEWMPHKYQAHGFKCAAPTPPAVPESK